MGPNPTRVCVDWVIFPCSAPDPTQNFGSTSPLFSKYTSRKLTERMCTRRTTRRRCRNSASDPEQSMGKSPNLHIPGLSMDNVGQFERITVINMQMHA